MERLAWVVAGLLGTIMTLAPSPFNMIAAITAMLWAVPATIGLFDRLGENWPPLVVSPFVIARPSRISRCSLPSRVHDASRLEPEKLGVPKTVRGPGRYFRHAPVHLESVQDRSIYSTLR